MFPETPNTSRAVARKSDPETSWQAAQKASVHIRDSQTLVWRIIRLHGPISDDALYPKLSYYSSLTPSGARTRRNELVKMGLVVFNKTYSKTKNGGKTREWRVATAAEFNAFHVGQEALL